MSVLPTGSWRCPQRPVSTAKWRSRGTSGHSGSTSSPSGARRRRRRPDGQPLWMLTPSDLKNEQLSDLRSPPHLITRAESFKNLPDSRCTWLFKSQIAGIGYAHIASKHPTQNLHNVSWQTFRGGCSRIVKKFRSFAWFTQHTTCRNSQVAHLNGSRLPSLTPPLRCLLSGATRRGDP